MPLSPGSNFGSYRIIESLGRGGMASVLRAYEAALDRDVALKVLPAEFLHDPDFAERFEREAKVVARLEHRHIIPIHAFGIEEGIPWMAMRMVSGGTLSGLVEQGAIEPHRTVAILGEAAEALDYAHSRGILHRDVKPQNTLLDEEGHVYLADFGIAKMVEGSGPLTQPGRMTGTPQYMSPEQARGLKVDHRTDIYALGIVAYEMMVGWVPFDADTPVAVLMKHVMDPIPLRVGVPPPLQRAVLKCLAKDPQDRWQSAAAFVRALEQGLAREAPYEPSAEQAPTRPFSGSRSTMTMPPTQEGLSEVSPLTLPGSWPSTTRPVDSPAESRRRPVSWRLPLLAVLGVVAIGALVLSRPDAPAESTATTPTLTIVPELRTSLRDGLSYVWVPPGSFQMGCVEGDTACRDDEKPGHPVMLSRGFWLGQTEVTVAAYRRFAEATGRRMPPAPGFNRRWSQDNHPIVNVSWRDAAAFCDWAGGRLPTEAEWEHAARAGRAGTRYPWGDQISHDRANYSGREAGDRWEHTAPVASFAPNDHGLHDMAGNAREWVADRYAQDYYATSPVTDPPGPDAGDFVVLRGGSWGYLPRYLRLSSRVWDDPGHRDDSAGLRCARDASP